MPIVEVHLVRGMHPDALLGDLLAVMSRRYATVLESPVERVRAFLVLHDARHCSVGGAAPDQDDVTSAAPYFSALVLEGRPVEQRHRLLGELTAAIVDVLGVERSRVRGRIVQVPPDDWGIGGVPAAEARRTEIESRAP